MSIDQQHACKESELADGVVSIVDGLCSLLADDAHSNMRSSDHFHVVRTITDRQCDHFSVFLAHETGEFGLLVFASTTGDDCLASLGYDEELGVRGMRGGQHTAFLQATAR